MSDTPGLTQDVLSALLVDGTRDREEVLAVLWDLARARGYVPPGALVVLVADVSIEPGIDTGFVGGHLRYTGGVVANLAMHCTPEVAWELVALGGQRVTIAPLLEDGPDV